MSGSEIWPPWRATIHSVLRRIALNGHDLASLVRESEELSERGEGTAVDRADVLRVLVEHELSKHPELGGSQTSAIPERDERALASLLEGAGWPSRRVRRLLSLQWRRTLLEGARLAEVELAPVPWVLRLGSGSARALAVARGARAAIEGPENDAHVSAVRRAIEEPPCQRVLVLRQCNRGLMVEDGNHFVVGMLMRFPDPERCPPLPCLVGWRPGRRPAAEDRHEEEVTPPANRSTTSGG